MTILKLKRRGLTDRERILAGTRDEICASVGSSELWNREVRGWGRQSQLTWTQIPGFPIRLELELELKRMT